MATTSAKEAQQRIQAHRDKLRQDADAKIAELVAAEAAQAAPVPVVEAAAAPVVDVSAVAQFRVWLQTPSGQDASDPRMPGDSVRRAVMLEDALEKAFIAGFEAASAV